MAPDRRARRSAPAGPGKVTPSAATMLRIRRIAAQAQAIPGFPKPSPRATLSAIRCTAWRRGACLADYLSGLFDQRVQFFVAQFRHKGQRTRRALPVQAARCRDSVRESSGKPAVVRYSRPRRAGREVRCAPACGLIGWLGRGRRALTARLLRRDGQLGQRGRRYRNFTWHGAPRSAWACSPWKAVRHPGTTRTAGLYTRAASGWRSKGHGWCC